MSFVDIWSWFEQPLHQPPLSERDRELRKIIELFDDGWEQLQTSPEAALAIFEQGRSRAEQLDVPCYALFFGYWACEAYVFYLRDMVRGLDYATKLVIEARKPIYRSCPVLSGVYRMLADVHLNIDPIGYEDAIRDTLDYLEHNVPMHYENYCLIHARRSSLDYELDNIQSAHDLGLRYLSLCEGNSFRLIHANLMLCTYTYEFGDLELALAYAKKSEAYARIRHRYRAIIATLAWQAVLNHKLGDVFLARQQYRQAAAKLSEYEFEPWLSYCILMGEYFELEGEPEKALSLYDRTYETLLNTGKNWSVCEYWLERCRLLGRVGMSFEHDLKSAYEAGANLLKPELYLAKLKRVESGDYSSRKVNG
jgi:hypothetical protein